ncbi:MAG: SRPBCC domain-containing protein [Caldivirga sp.]|jgi:carbon monoxide dehydrogenase subunit G
MKLSGQKAWGGEVNLGNLWQLIEGNTLTLVKCVPDTSDIRQVGPQEFEFKIMVQMGPVRGTFNSRVKITSIDRDTGKVTMTLNSKGPGAVMDASITAIIGESGVTYDADVKLTGLLAAVGERIIRNYIDGKLNEFLNNLMKLAKTGQC